MVAVYGHRMGKARVTQSTHMHTQSEQLAAYSCRSRRHAYIERMPKLHGQILS